MQIADSNLSHHKCTGSSQRAGKPGLTMMEVEVKVPLGIIAQMCACAFKKCILSFWIPNENNYSKLNNPSSLQSFWNWAQHSSSRTTMLVLASNSSDNTNCTHKHRPYYLIVMKLCRFPSGSDESGVWICQRLWFIIKNLFQTNLFGQKIFS